MAILKKTDSRPRAVAVPNAGVLHDKYDQARLAFQAQVDEVTTAADSREDTLNVAAQQIFDERASLTALRSKLSVAAL